MGGELPACSEQVILEEKLIWQSPASSSFSLPAQVGEGSQAQADLSNRSLALPPSQSFLPGFKPGEVKVRVLQGTEEESRSQSWSIHDGPAQP